jgi:hypothetical protein
VGHADGVILPTFTVTAPTRAFLDYGAREREITLAAGTRLRWVRAGGMGDPCSDIYLNWDEFEPLDGEFAGLVVTVEDAATPRDERAAQGYGPQWGTRPRLGPPTTITPDSPIPIDIPWPAFGG